MQTVTLGTRTEKPAYLDLSGGIRMGDLACLHLWLLQWRAVNPERKITVYYNPHHARSVYAKDMSIAWIFGDIADVIHISDADEEVFSIRTDEESFGDIYKKVHIWDRWRDYMTGKTKVEPSIRIDDYDNKAAESRLSTLGIKGKFCTIAPLVDAGYNKSRNESVVWWSQVISSLAHAVKPLLVLGPQQYMSKLSVPPSVIPAWKDQLSPMESLAIINKSGLHLGGETGLTLWAAMLGTPVGAMYRVWSTGGGGKYDYRPIAFKAPVIWIPLGGNPTATAESIYNIWNGNINHSSPVI